MKKIRVQFLLWVYRHTQVVYRRFFKRKKRHWNFTTQELLAFEEDTLGRKLGEFYHHHGFSMIPTMENHDVHHLITDYGIKFEEEIAMQYLLLGNGKLNAHLIAAILLGTLMLPEYIFLYQKAYKKGQNMKSFYQWDFRELLDVNFFQLKDFIQQKDIPVLF